MLLAALDRLYRILRLSRAVAFGSYWPAMLNWLKTIDMIIIDDIRKGFGRVEVLKGISLEVR